MGIEISKITNQELQKLANLKDADNNGVLEGDEITVFKTEAATKEGVSTEDFNQAMGLNITNPIKAQAPAKADKKERKEYENQVKDDVKELVKTLSPDELIPVLRSKYTNSAYAPIIADVEKLLAAVNATNYNSKEDVEKIKDNVKKNPDFKDMTGFQKGILDALVDQAKDEQIVKEATELYEMYEAEKAKMPEADKNNAQKILDRVKEQIKDRKSYYKKEAFNELKNIVGKEVRDEQTGRLSSTTGHKSGKVEDELLDGVAKDDKFTRRIIKKKMKTEREIASRHNKFEDRQDELTHISEKDLKKKLGDDLFLKLNASYLADKRNEDGTYNISALSDLVLYRVGYDYELNRSKDTEMSEMRNLQVELKEATGQDFSEKEVKKILDLVAIKKEGRKRNVGKALLDGIIPGVAGAFGALISSGKLDVTQKVQLNINDSATANEMVQQLTAAGANPNVITNADGTITINILQKVLRDNRVLNVIAGFGIGYLQGVAMSLLIGEDIAFEKSCISISDFDVENGRYTDIDKFEEYIRARYPEKKADTVMLVAKTFVDEQGRFDLLGFQSKLNEIAGVGSNVNCKEMTGARIYKENEQPVNPNNDDDDDDTPVCEAIVKDESTPERTEPVDNTKVHKVTYGDSWEGIIKAYYPCLVEKHNGQLYGKDGAIRELKKALAYDDNGTFQPEVYRKLLAGYIPSSIKLPAEINGCQREDGEVKKVKITGRGPVRGMGQVGRSSYRVNTIPGTNQWRATDGCDGTSVTAGSREEAVTALAKQTGKNYTGRVVEK